MFWFKSDGHYNYSRTLPRVGTIAFTLYPYCARLHRNRVPDNLFKRTRPPLVNRDQAGHACVHIHQMNWTLGSDPGLCRLVWNPPLPCAPEHNLLLPTHSPFTARNPHCASTCQVVAESERVVSAVTFKRFVSNSVEMIPSRPALHTSVAGHWLFCLDTEIFCGLVSLSWGCFH